MCKYRKKPVIISAFHWLGDQSFPALQDFTAAGEYNRNVRMKGGRGNIAQIVTLEGIMDAQPGDYIIKGIKGEFYPCKPDIFEATYEKVDD